MALRTAGKHPWKYDWALYAFVVLAAILQVWLTYHLAVLRPVAEYSTLKLFLVRLSVLVPEALIWFLAARSARRFKSYAITIKAEKDGQAMHRLANGLVLLVVYIVILSFASPLVSLMAYSGAAQLVLFLANHVPVVLAMLAAYLLYKGSSALGALTNQTFWTKKRLILSLGPYTLLMILFAVDFYTQSPHLVTAEGVKRFVLPPGVLLFSYVLTHMTVWLLGLVAALNLVWYAQRVKGSIYRSLFRDAARGMILVFISIFLAQLLIVSPLVVTHFSFGLFLIYLLLVVAISGYTLLFRGAVKLQQLEEAG